MRVPALSAASAAACLAFAIAAGSAAAQEPCGLCAEVVVTNSALASCFLERFDGLAQKASAAVAVDLSDCPAERGVVEALPGPGVAVEDEPDVKFLLSQTQLDCLKARLEEPGLVLDPQARIELGGCG